MVASVSVEVTTSLFWIILATALAPLVGRLARGLLPQAVLLLLAGVLIGPSVLGLASETDLDLADVAEQPLFLLVALVAIVLLRGGGIYLTERLVDTGSGLRTARERGALSLYGATGLPIIVAVTEVATANDLMPEEIGSGLVATGALSVLVLPLLARRLLAGGTPGDAPDQPRAGQPHAGAASA